MEARMEARMENPAMVLPGASNANAGLVKAAHKGGLELQRAPTAAGRGGRPARADPRDQGHPRAPLDGACPDKFEDPDLRRLGVASTFKLVNKTLFEAVS